NTAYEHAEFLFAFPGDCLSTGTPRDFGDHEQEQGNQNHCRREEGEHQDSGETALRARGHRGPGLQQTVFLVLHRVEKSLNLVIQRNSVVGVFQLLFGSGNALFLEIDGLLKDVYSFCDQRSQLSDALPLLSIISGESLQTIQSLREYARGDIVFDQQRLVARQQVSSPRIFRRREFRGGVTYKRQDLIGVNDLILALGKSIRHDVGNNSGTYQQRQNYGEDDLLRIGGRQPHSCPANSRAASAILRG